MPTPRVTHVLYPPRQFGPPSHAPARMGADSLPGGAQYIADAIAALDMASKQLGLQLTEETADLCLGQVRGESNFGREGTLGGNDWGAFQAGSTQGGKPVWIPAFQKKYAQGPKGVGGLAHRDSHPSGQSYVAYYRVYPTQLAAAEDWLSVMAPRLGLAAGMGGAQEYAAKAYAVGYFEGSHPGDAQANIDDYARLVEGNAQAVAVVRSRELKGRDPRTIDFPSVRPLVDRLSAGLVKPGATLAQKIQAARSAFPKGGAQGDYDALTGSQGLAWIVGPPPGYAVDGSKGWPVWKKVMAGLGVFAGGLGIAAAVGKE